MELYSPTRHYYSLRNLRLLLRCSDVPRDLKVKEVLKMTIKPWLWLLFEPNRVDNIKAIYNALRATVPSLEAS